MIDIVTVVFAPELALLKTQANSVSLYVNNSELSTVWVVVNDADSLIAHIDKLWWGVHAHKVRIIPRSMFGADYYRTGWDTQQALKILASAQSNSDWCVILDAKTFFIQPVNLSRIFDTHGKVCMRSQPIVSVFADSHQMVNDFFDIDMTHVAGPAGVPHFFRTTEIKHMVEYIQERTGQQFLLWFQAQGLITEFLLYSGWLHYRYKNLNHYYVEQQYYQIENICHSEVPDFEVIFERMKSAQALTVGIHRNAWTQLSDDQKMRYLEFLQKKDIVHDVSTTYDIWCKAIG